MARLQTEYMGLELNNPIVVSSSGLTENADGVLKCQEAGAAAVVMKSIFEEQIETEVDDLFRQSPNMHPEMTDYLDIYAREHSIKTYLDQIRKAKKAASIPVFGSINCMAPGRWSKFVTRMEETGIDGLELNIYVMPENPGQSSETVEQIYFDIFNEVRETATVPLALKLPPYLTAPVRFIQRLHEEGAAAFVLFNRPVPFDIDIEKQAIAVKNVISSPTEMSFSLRMISRLAGHGGFHLAAGTGIHDTESVIKHLLAGADTVQLCSVLYKNGYAKITDLLHGLERWLDDHGIKSADEIRGKLAQKNSEHRAAYERVQYMKAFTAIS
ncbi:dihydroorotate dehydrogenase-like protein [bacterium]|nr:dihydroorotate dehydrogenase-like protein [bacterium]